ncbi:hypothetical protein M569_09783 [Genlisea aurea]|uniref:Uncharacterized protein n=1 Tax=Genlisea aurea TaxID=192259 RepID=S8CJX5_9LAMI|nr:hypothetical protein M569_09783 [Genlisea aurea]
MASNGLPLMQMPFITVPAQCSPKNMAFCSAVSRRSYFGNLVSSVLPTPANGAYSSSERSSRGFYSIRAEVAADSVVETKQSEEENVSPSDSDEAAGVLTAEEKPPRRPRIKLGDIMGFDMNTSVSIYFHWHADSI